MWLTSIGLVKSLPAYRNCCCQRCCNSPSGVWVRRPAWPPQSGRTAPAEASAWPRPRAGGRPAVSCANWTKLMWWRHAAMAAGRQSHCPPFGHRRREVGVFWTCPEWPSLCWLHPAVFGFSLALISPKCVGAHISLPRRTRHRLPPRMWPLLQFR